MRRSTTAAARGFTLLEVMIVIVIILAIVGLVTVNLMSTRGRATERTAEIQLASIRDALRQFHLEFNRYPTDEEGLEVLWNRDVLDPDAEERNWRPFLEEPIPNDPWGNEWGYRQDGENAPEGMFDLWSNGPDGEEGTDDDINVWRTVDGDGFGGGGGLPPPPPG